MNKLTVLEMALLFALAEKYSALCTHIDKIYVTERECTGMEQYLFLKYYNENDILPISESVISVYKIIIAEGLEKGIGLVENTENFKAFFAFEKKCRLLMEACICCFGSI